jgi:hypothetical protein
MEYDLLHVLEYFFSLLGLGLGLGLVGSRQATFS